MIDGDEFILRSRCRADGWPMSLNRHRLLRVERKDWRLRDYGFGLRSDGPNGGPDFRADRIFSKDVGAKIGQAKEGALRVG